MKAAYSPDKAEADYQAAMVKYKEAAATYKLAADAATADGKPVPPNAPRPPVKVTNGGVHQNSPTALYNGMIHPLLKFPIKGAIWYQGESNAGRAFEYRTLFPAMIADWRKQWGIDFPFFAVQLAPFSSGNSAGVNYAELRDAQVYATKALPKVGVAVITDAGHETNIHPQAKEPAGRRLALAARAIAYGEKVEYQGPTFKAVAIAGAKATVTFDHAAGLKATGDTVAGFTLAGSDNVFHPATAVIDGDKVTVTSDKVPAPASVRFGWVNFAKPTLNLVNAAGLPAVPFRTDELSLTTAPKAKK